VVGVGQVICNGYMCIPCAQHITLATLLAARREPAKALIRSMDHVSSLAGQTPSNKRTQRAYQ